ncbi:AAA family ATPase [Salinarimonas rosea]|uniref:AAA family ATPase n=1 Tax=Salinarimonas rosea TaxID=552063 RepID=UPI00048F441D|nr:AAA family ATPase [Salinarimonas rosea]
MKVLITGMSGSGKSTAIATLRKMRYRAIDLDDDGWSSWQPCTGDPTGANPGHDWLWDEGRLSALLDDIGDEMLFLAGCAPNMGRFAARFDRIVLLTAPIEVLLDRVLRRSGNDYGKSPTEAERIAENAREIEPILRRIATDEVNTNRPANNVLMTVLQIANCY